MNGLIQSRKQLEKLAKIEEEQDKVDEKFMLEAIKEAKKAYRAGEIPVGAVIVRDGEIIARAYNQKEKKNCALYHAEIIALLKASRKLGWRLDGCEIYVTSEPCLMCAGAIISSRISRVVYGLKEEKSGFFESNQLLSEIYNGSGLNHKVKVKGGILKEECFEVFNKFFADKRDNIKNN